MKLIVYKGFNSKILSTISGKPLIEGKITNKLDVLKFDKKLKKRLDMALLYM